MPEINYTQVSFATPEARVKYSEASLEVKARKVAGIYNGLRLDANDGTFALWAEDDLVHELHELMLEVLELDKAREVAS